ncbi:MAG TPA: hypothetical protein VHX38_11030 [Pseudonocardiaceae bacterium]|jgi:hypothetical protein|nr:hypothetical protein [Pseudonocardiaceae bacterium]
MTGERMTEGHLTEGHMTDERTTDERMSKLESRYRRLLRVLPSWYRRDREEEMVDTLLSGRAEPNALDGRPGLAEAGAVLGLAVRTRLAGTGPARAVAVGNAVRLTALLGLLVSTGVAMGQLAQLVIEQAWLRGGPFQPPANRLVTDLVYVIGYLAVPGVCVAAVAGRRWPARILALVALVPSGNAVLDLLRRAIHAGPLYWDPYAGGFISTATLWVAVVCLWVGFHRAAPRPPAGWWRTALALVVLGGLGWGVFCQLSPVDLGQDSLGRILLDRNTMPTSAVIVLGVGYLFAAGLRRVDFSGSWALALAVSAVVLIPGQLAVLLATLRLDAVWTGFYIGQLLALVVMTVSLVIMGGKKFRRIRPAGAG